MHHIAAEFDGNNVIIEVEGGGGGGTDPALMAPLVKLPHAYTSEMILTLQN